MARRSERGSSLIVALILLAVVAVLVPAVLSLTFTGTKVTDIASSDRHRTYAAVSALDAAVQHGRSTPWVGRVGLACPTMTVAIGSDTATVTCTSSTGLFDLDRSVAYVAEVEGAVWATAEVIFRDGTAGAGEPAVDIVSWYSVPAT